MTTTYDPHHPAFHDEADVRGELTRVFEVCHGCRRCATACSSFVSLFDMLAGPAAGDAGSLTPAQQDRVVDECYQCRWCRSVCPFVPPSPAAVDFPRLMARTVAMRRAAGQRPIRDVIGDQVLARPDRWGRLATHAGSAVNAVARARPGSLRRRVLALVAGVSPNARLLPFAARSLSSSTPRARRTPGSQPVGRVTVFATCLVEHRRPEVGRALLAAYAHNGVACDVAAAGCCGAPWLTNGDTRRFGARAARNVTILADAIRAGSVVVVAQPTCHAVITTDYPDHVPGADAELVATRTFDAMRYLADRNATAPPLRDRIPGALPARVVHHEPLPAAGGEASAAAEVLELAGAAVDVVRQCTGVDGRWPLRVANERVAAVTLRHLAADIERSPAEAITGTCLLTNAAIAEQTGREVVHPLELMARAYGLDSV